MGYDIGCILYNTAIIGQTKIGQPLNGKLWRYTVGIIAQQTNYVRAKIGIARAGEPIATWGNRSLEILVSDLLPAWMAPVFDYISGSPLTNENGLCLTDETGAILYN